VVVLRGDEDEAVAAVDRLAPAGDTLVVVLALGHAREGGGSQERDVEGGEVDDLGVEALALVGGLLDPLGHGLAGAAVADGPDDDADLHVLLLLDV
jgi:hypothetical protein